LPNGNDCSKSIRVNGDRDGGPAPLGEPQWASEKKGGGKLLVSGNVRGGKPEAKNIKTQAKLQVPGFKGRPPPIDREESLGGGGSKNV